jgi:hypothetical protein
MFDVKENGDGTVDVMNVPVFKAHNDRRYVCDEQWLDRCVADFLHQKIDSIEVANGNAKYAMLPSLTIGHTPESADAPEPPRVGFVDNLRRVGKVLYADFVNISKNAWEQIKRGDFPYRSAEVIPSKHRLTNVSLLGGRYPHFSLPVMRFKQRGAEIVRYVYTEDCNDMDMDPQTLAQQIAPLVAQILAEGQANAMNNDMASSGMSGGMASAGGMDTDPTEEGDVEEGSSKEQKPDGPEAYRARRPKTHPYRTSRYEIEHTSKGADHGDDNFKPSSDAESVDFSTEEQGVSKTTKNSTPSPVSRYEAEIVSLRSQLAELQRHNAREAQAAKRMMLSAKCREIASLGYAIGDRDQIDRHVNRMMTMRSDEVRDYVEDVLKRSPKVEMVARHGISDYIERPGRASSENERYIAENPEQITRLGLDRSVLDLSDVLSG